MTYFVDIRMYIHESSLDNHILPFIHHVHQLAEPLASLEGEFVAPEYILYTDVRAVVGEPSGLVALHFYPATMFQVIECLGEQFIVILDGTGHLAAVDEIEFGGEDQSDSHVVDFKEAVCWNPISIRLELLLDTSRVVITKSVR
jgi:hypothetical protein